MRNLKKFTTHEDQEAFILKTWIIMAFTQASVHGQQVVIDN
jgi:hypothetical protein